MQEAKQLLSELKNIPSGKAHLRLSQQNRNLSKSLYTFRNLSRLLSKNKISKKEIEDLNKLVDQVMNSSPSIEHTRIAIETYTYQRQDNLGSSDIAKVRSLLEAIDITVPDEIEEWGEHIQTLPLREYKDRTYLYGMYLLGDNKIRNEIHELLRHVPLNYSYFRLIRWLYTYAETFAIPELFSIIAIRIYQTDKNKETTAYRDGTPTSLRRRINRNFKKYSSEQQDTILKLMLQDVHIRNALPWPLIQKLTQYRLSFTSPKYPESSLNQALKPWLTYLIEKEEASEKYELPSENYDLSFGELLLKHIQITSPPLVHEVCIRIYANSSTETQEKYKNKIEELSLYYAGYLVLLSQLSSKEERAKIIGDAVYKIINSHHPLSITHKKMIFSFIFDEHTDQLEDIFQNVHISSNNFSFIDWIFQQGYHHSLSNNTRNRLESAFLTTLMKKNLYTQDDRRLMDRLLSFDSSIFTDSTYSTITKRFYLSQDASIIEDWQKILSSRKEEKPTTRVVYLLLKSPHVSNHTYVLDWLESHSPDEILLTAVEASKNTSKKVRSYLKKHKKLITSNSKLFCMIQLGELVNPYHHSLDSYFNDHRYLNWSNRDELKKKYTSRFYHFLKDIPSIHYYRENNHSWKTPPAYSFKTLLDLYKDSDAQYIKSLIYGRSYFSDKNSKNLKLIYSYVQEAVAINDNHNAWTSSFLDVNSKFGKAFNISMLKWNHLHLLREESLDIVDFQKYIAMSDLLENVHTHQFILPYITDILIPENEKVAKEVFLQLLSQRHINLFSGTKYLTKTGLRKLAELLQAEILQRVTDTNFLQNIIPFCDSDLVVANKRLCYIVCYTGTVEVFNHYKPKDYTSFFDHVLDILIEDKNSQIDNIDVFGSIIEKRSGIESVLKSWMKDNSRLWNLIEDLFCNSKSNKLHRRFDYLLSNLPENIDIFCKMLLSPSVYVQNRLPFYRNVLLPKFISQESIEQLLKLTFAEVKKQNKNNDTLEHFAHIITHCNSTKINCGKELQQEILEYIDLTLKSSRFKSTVSSQKWIAISLLQMMPEDYYTKEKINYLLSNIYLQILNGYNDWVLRNTAREILPKVLKTICIPDSICVDFFQSICSLLLKTRSNDASLNWQDQNLITLSFSHHSKRVAQIKPQDHLDIVNALLSSPNQILQNLGHTFLADVNEMFIFEDRGLLRKFLLSNHSNLTEIGRKKLFQIYERDYDSFLEIVHETFLFWLNIKDNNYWGEHSLQDIFRKMTRQDVKNFISLYPNFINQLFGLGTRLSHPNLLREVFNKIEKKHLIKNVNKIITFLFSNHWQYSQLGQNLLQKIIQHYTKKERYNLIIKLFDKGKPNSNTHAFKTLLEHDLAQTIKNNFTEDLLQRIEKGLTWNSNLAHIMLTIIQKNLTIPQMIERPAILKAISYGPHQIASFKAIFDSFRKHDKTFLRRWMEECLETFTTMSSSTLHYVLWLLDKTLLYKRFISVAKQNNSHYYQIIERYLKEDYWRFHKIIEAFLQEMDLEDVIVHRVDLCLTLLNHHNHTYRNFVNQNRKTLKSLSANAKNILVAGICENLLTDCQYSEHLDILSHDKLRLTLYEYVSQNQDACAKLGFNLLLQHQSYSTVKKRRDIGLEILPKISEDIWITYPKEFFELSMHKEYGSYFQDKILSTLDRNISARKAFLPLYLHHAVHFNRPSYHLQVVFPKYRSIGLASVYTIDSSISIPKKGTWKSIIANYQSKHQTHPEKLPFSITISDRTYTHYLVSTNGSMMLCDNYTYYKWSANTVDDLLGIKTDGLIIAPWFIHARTESNQKNQTGGVFVKYINKELWIRWNIQPFGQTTYNQKKLQLEFFVKLTQNGQVSLHYNKPTPLDSTSNVPAAANVIIESKNNKNTILQLQDRAFSNQYDSHLQTVGYESSYPTAEQSSSPFSMKVCKEHPSWIQNLNYDDWIKLMSMCRDEELSKLLFDNKPMNPVDDLFTDKTLSYLVSISYEGAIEYISKVISTNKEELAYLTPKILPFLNHSSEVVRKRICDVLYWSCQQDEKLVSKVLFYLLTNIQLTKESLYTNLLKDLLDRIPETEIPDFADAIHLNLSETSDFTPTLLTYIESILHTNFSFVIKLLDKMEMSSQKSTLELVDQLATVIDSFLEDTSHETIENIDWWSSGLDCNPELSKKLNDFIHKIPSINDASATKIGLQLLRSQKETTDSNTLLQISLLLEGIPQQDFGKYAYLLLKITTHNQKEVRDIGYDFMQSTLSQDNATMIVLLNTVSGTLSREEKVEGLHQEWVELIQSQYASYLSDFTSHSTWKMLRSPSFSVQLLGIMIMKKTFAPDAISIEKLVEMSNHDCVEVRKYVWDLYTNNKERILKNLDVAIKGLESRWEDSREFFFSYFEAFTEDEWDLRQLIRVCDSNLPDVQEFGQKLLTTHMNASEGKIILQKLSQHPAQSVEEYVSQKLLSHASDDLQSLQHLIPYFKRVFARVNQGRSTRNQVLAFIEKETLTSNHHAVLLTPLIIWLSNIHVKKDKVWAISLLLKIKDKFPQIPNPIT